MALWAHGLYKGYPAKAVLDTWSSWMHCMAISGSSGVRVKCDWLIKHTCALLILHPTVTL